MALVPGHDRLADRRPVPGLIAYPVPGPVHQHAAQQGGRRAEEAPDRDAVQERGPAARLGAEPDPAAVVTGRRQRQAAAVGGRVLAHHLPVGGEPAGGQHHAAPGVHPQRAAVAALQPGHRAVHDPPDPGCVQVRPGRPAVQHPVCGPGPARRAAQRPALDPGHPAPGPGHQPLRGGLAEHPGPGPADGRGQPGVEQPARGAAAAGPVPAGRRRHAAGGQLTAGVVEVVPVRGVGGLIRAQAALERHPVLLQPGHHGPAAAAELRQRGRRHGVADLQGEVTEHRLRGVRDTRLALLRGAAARVDHSAGQGRGPAAGEPVEHDHVRTAARGFQGGAGPRGPEPHHDDIGLDVPGLRHRRLRGRTMWPPIGIIARPKL